MAFPAQGGPCAGTSCDWSFANIPWVTGHSYIVVSSATDAARNQQNNFASEVGVASNTFTFVAPTSLPTVGLTNPNGTLPDGGPVYPRTGTLTTITGTAAVTVANDQLQIVQLRVQDDRSGNYWNPVNGLFDPTLISPELAFTTATYVTKAGRAGSSPADPARARRTPCRWTAAGNTTSRRARSTRRATTRCPTTPSRSSMTRKPRRRP